MSHVKMKLELRQIQVMYQHMLTKKIHNNVMTVTMPLSESQNWISHPGWEQQKL
jgi:hypothetical protein